MGVRRAGGRTIRTRLVLSLSFVICLALAASAVITTFAVRDYLNARLSSQLIAASTRMEPSLRALNGVTLDYWQLIAVLARQATITVVESDGRAVAWSHTDESTANDLVQQQVSEAVPQPVDDHPNLVAIRVNTSGMGLATLTAEELILIDGVVIALDSTDDLASVRGIITTNVVATIVVVVALIVLTNVIIGRGLRPLRAISRRAGAVAGGGSDRLPVTDNDPDIERLAVTVNAAFDAQQAAEVRLRDFVADASHELRTPLTTASGWVELYLQGGLADATSRDRAMERVEAELGRMRLLVDELALLARLDRGRPLDLATVDLAALVTEAVADARIANPQSPVTFTSTAPCWVIGDAARLRQVLHNLIGNAVQHTPPGTAVTVTVEQSHSTDRTAVTQVRVTDDGPGIPITDQAHVFERFWRGDHSRSRNTGGSGLGLAIVGSIVSAHGGSIEISSQQAVGTSVRMTLPSPAATAPAPAGSRSAETRATETAPR